MAREDQAYIARQAIWDRLSREVDPDRKLTPQERAVLIQSAAKRLSARLNAAKARKRSQRTAWPAPEPGTGASLRSAVPDAGQ